MRTSLSLLALSSTVGCATPADEFRDVLPDDRLVIDDGGFAMLARGAGEPSDYATLTHDVIADLNGGIEDVIGLVELITTFPATWSGRDDEALWGPWEDDGTSGQLWVHGTKAEGYTWAIEIRPTHDKGDWTPVLAGQVDSGATKDASTGRFAIDFTAIASAEAGDGELGALTTEYALRPDGAEATIALGEFSDDGSVPADGAVHYDHTKGQGGLMDLALEADVNDPANGTLEVVIVRSRWIGDGQGRADAYLTGGDLGELTYTETDCWDSTQTTVFFENNFELLTSGDPSSCVFADAQYPPEE
jgi:hypothetical protein